jgi:2-succinyl-5-enolpyruvyl-6-hydroxy-3-cyclohexene-1-carboxylate synthase
MRQPLNRTYAPIQAVVDELARCGVRNAVTCPGSRNAPLALALADDERIDAVSILDERSAGFAALGMAKATGRPVVLTCTSGTAAANLLPAIVEAREARVPLVVLTADRPPELRDVGAGQAIDQVKLYGGAVKWFCEVGNHEPGRQSAIHHRSLACRAYAAAAGGRPGAVHLNFPLREPLAPVAEEDPRLSSAVWAGRPGGAPWVGRSEPELAPDAGLVDDLVAAIGGSSRGAFVCGAGGIERAEGLARLAATAGWPILAEPTSGLRCGHHDRSHVVSHYDALLRSEGFSAAHRAEVVVRLGDTPTSKPLRSWLSEAARQVVVDPHAAWHEPTRSAALMVGADADLLCEALAAGGEQAAAGGGWLGSWLRADALVPPTLATAPDPFEPKAYAALAESLPSDATVWVGSSMPIRDVETFFPSVATPIRFLANRGANGIDGAVSSAAGAALALGGRCHLLTGELALLHDVGGLVTARDLGAELTIVCVNNGGGGIFDFLPVSEHADAEAYERHVATPRAVDLRELAALGSLRHTLARTPDEVRAAAAEPGLVEVRTDRADSVAWHRDVFARVDAALEPRRGAGGR